MQIREQGKKIQLIRSVYNSTTKKCDQKLIGTVDRSDDSKLSMVAGYEMRPDEHDELNAWLKIRRDKNLSDDIDSSIRVSDGLITKFANAVKAAPDRLDEDKAAKIYAALDELAKALRKAGHKRPAKAQAE